MLIMLPLLDADPDLLIVAICYSIGLLLALILTHSQLALLIQQAATLGFTFPPLCCVFTENRAALICVLIDKPRVSILIPQWACPQLDIRDSIFSDHRTGGKGVSLQRDRWAIKYIL